jgi:glyoxylate/hydroxypyruvate reductase
LRRLRSFGIDRFLYNDTGRGPSRESADVDLRQQFNLKELRRVGLDELAAECDLIITLTPGGALTHHLVNESFLRKMKKTAILVNPSRGTVVDSNALALALKESWIWAAGLDVVEGEPDVGLDHPLVQQPR